MLNLKLTIYNSFEKIMTNYMDFPLLIFTLIRFINNIFLRFNEIVNK